MYDAYNPIYACPRAGLGHPRGLITRIITTTTMTRMMERSPEFRADTRSLHYIGNVGGNMIGNVGVTLLVT